MEIEEFWKALPSEMKRGNKICANTRYIRIKKAGELESLQKALEAYKDDQAANTWRNFQYCPSWLGSAAYEPWKEWMKDEKRLDMFESKLIADATEKLVEARARGIYRMMERDFRAGLRPNLPAIQDIIDGLKTGDL